MQYFDFAGLNVSRLGFGAMRMPVIDSNAGQVDMEALQSLVDRAIAGGINYFDTAYSYHLCNSEAAISKALSKYPRESYFLADKFPGHEIRSVYKPAEIFQEQLDRCETEYFDFYLMHNVTELSIDTYLDERWGIVEYALQQKEAGRIRHLGFSAHGRLDTIKRFMEHYGQYMEFCQLQVNYLDWTLQDINKKYEYIASWGIPVWVMEPVRGGALAQFDDSATTKLRSLRPDESTAAWAFRWLQGLDHVGIVLSGMNSMDQMEDNLKTFSESKPLNEEEKALVEVIAAGLVDQIPCTSCRYCTRHCPMGLDIPNLLSLANDARMRTSYTVRMGIDALPDDKRPGACIGCRACTQVCPQNIEIPECLQELQEKVDKLIPWAELRKYD